MTTDYRDEWLAALGQRVGLNSLAFDESAVCQLVLDDDLILTLHKPETSTKLVVFGQLPVPPLPIEVMKHMLKRNRTNAKLSAPVLSLSPEEDAIEAHLVLDKEDLAQSDDWLEALIEELDFWRTSSLNDFKETSREQIDLNVNFV